jgi:acetylornithine deacetylase
MLAGHIDVVPADAQGWEFDPFEAQVTPDRVIDRGTADMKGFLACAMALASHIKGSGCPVTLVVTDDEERTFPGPRHLIGQLAGCVIRPALNVVGEPTLCRVAIAHPGFSDWVTTFTGIEGQSDQVDPETGAIDAAVRFTTRLRAAARKAGDQPPRINFGQIAGRTARNIVAATCTLYREARIANTEKSAWLSAWLDANGALFQTSDCVARADSFASTAGPGLLKICRAATDSDLIQVHCASEPGLYEAAGFATVVIGPGDIAVAHRPAEHLEVEQISRMLGCMTELANAMTIGSSLVNNTTDVFPA